MKNIPIVAVLSACLLAGCLKPENGTATLTAPSPDKMTVNFDGSYFLPASQSAKESRVLTRSDFEKRPEQERTNIVKTAEKLVAEGNKRPGFALAFDAQAVRLTGKVSDQIDLTDRLGNRTLLGIAKISKDGPSKILIRVEGNQTAESGITKAEVSFETPARVLIDGQEISKGFFGGRSTKIDTSGAPRTITLEF